MSPFVKLLKRWYGCSPKRITNDTIDTYLSNQIISQDEYDYILKQTV